MTLGSPDVVRVSCSTGRGTGFLIAMEGRSLLLTALHVVAERDRVLRWATDVTAKLDDDTELRLDARVEFDIEDDWVAYEVRDVPQQARTLTPQAPHSHHEDAKVSCYGYPEHVGQCAMGGVLRTVNCQVEQATGSVTTKRRCLQVWLDEVAHGILINGMSGAPAAIEGRCIGMISCYLAAGPARGYIRPIMKPVKAGTRLRRQDGALYVVVKNTLAGHAIEVQSLYHGAAFDCPARSTLKFVDSAIADDALVVPPGICGGADELAQVAAKHGAGKLIGGIVLLTPIDRILEKLRKHYPRPHKSVETHCTAVRGKIAQQLRSVHRQGLSWAAWQGAAGDAESLAAAMLATTSARDFTNQFLTLMAEIERRNNPADRALADALFFACVEGLPIVAGPGWSLVVERGVYPVNLSEPIVAEVALAFDERGRVTMAEKDGHHSPVHYINLEDQPEYGVGNENLAPILGLDIAVRTMGFVKKVLISRNALGDYPDPTLDDVRSMLETHSAVSQRHYYTIIKTASTEFVQALREGLPDLRILVSTANSAREFRDMIAPLKQIHATYAAYLRRIGTKP